MSPIKSVHKVSIIGHIDLIKREVYIADPGNLKNQLDNLSFYKKYLAKYLKKRKLVRSNKKINNLLKKLLVWIEYLHDSEIGHTILHNAEKMYESIITLEHKVDLSGLDDIFNLETNIVLAGRIVYNLSKKMKLESKLKLDDVHEFDYELPKFKKIR